MSDSESDSEGEKIRRTKRKVVVKFEFDDSESSQSDSDVSIQPTRTPVHSGHGHDANASMIEGVVDVASRSYNIRPRRMGPPINTQNSQTLYDDDESSDSSWCPERAGPSSRPNARNMPQRDSSQCEIEPVKDDNYQSDTSSDDAGNEKCPICLHSFREQEIGMPNICEHAFCARCIEEWSKNVQTCPIDRKEFSYIIVRDRFENGKFVREIKVVAQSTILLIEDDDTDMTLCEICGHGGREDRMLLCDDCNLGYHMDCLNPPLTEVPSGSWYCDNCFASELSSGDDDINQLIEEFETEIGIPETRLRVRRISDQPRITRTRQSERIRAAIINRIAPSRRHADVDQEQSALGIIMPGTSRITTTTTTTTTSTRTTRLPTGRRKKRRKQRRRHRTYVVEYDVNNFDDKFSLKTTKKVVKRRRRKTTSKPKLRTLKRKRVSGGRCRRSTARATANVEGECSTRSGVPKPIDGGYPKLHLFGNKKALEYFSDDDESGNEFDEHSGHGLGGDGGTSMLATALTRTRIGGNSSLRRRKRIVSALDANPATAESIDILSNIMDTMDRLNPVVRPNELIKKDDDLKKKIGKPDDKQAPAQDTNNSDVLHAPMYPGGASGSSGGYNGNRFQSNDQSFRNTSRSSGGTSNNTANTSSGATASSSSGTSMSFSIFGPRPTPGSVGNNCGSAGSATNNFQNRFPTTPQNRTPRPQFRPRTPFNQTPPPQRFSPRNFNNRFLRPQNESPNIDVPRQGLYDDVEMAPNSQDIRVPTTPSLLDMRVSNPNTNITDMRTPPQHTPQRDFPPNHRMSAPPPHLQSPMNMQQHHISPMNRPPMQQQTFVNTMHELPPPQSLQMQHLPSRPSMTLGSPMCMQTPPPPVPPMMLHTPTHIMPPPIIPQIPFNNSQMYGPDAQNPIQVLGCMPPPKSFNANHSFNNFNQNNENQNQNNISDSNIDSEENICQSNLISIAAEDIPLPTNDTTGQNSTLRGLADYSGSDDEDDCPNLLVYSAESLNMAKQPDSMDEPLVFGPINRPCNEHEMERDEDLVQMDGDDDEEEEEDEQNDDNVPTGNVPLEGRSSHNENRDESKVATSSAKKNVLELYDDSDWEEYNVKNDEEKTVSKPNADSRANDGVEQADERSYTPCLDEQFQTSGEGDKIKDSNEDVDRSDDDISSAAGDDDKDKNDGNNSLRGNSVGIAGMETELISDDDDEDILSKGQNGANEGSRGGSNRNGKKTAEKRKDTKSHDDGKEKNRRKKDDSFKKISRSNKDRNYRDKKFDTKRRGRRNRSRSRSRSKSRTRSRSRSNNKENRRFYKRDKFRRRDNKRKDIERYDVRHIIAERQPRTFKDKYGRDTSRPPRSRSPSLSRSRKRTKSPSRSRRSRSIISISPRRRSVSRRRSLSRVRSISRGRRRSLSRPSRRISRSPLPSLRRRSRTPVRSSSRSRPMNDRQLRLDSISPRQFNRAPSRQPSVSPVRSKVRSKNRRKDGEKKAVKRKMKKRLKCPEPTKKAATITAMNAARSRSKSWENIDRLSPWSRSPTPLRIDDPNNDHSWTPPLAAAESENVTVILRNKDKRKKEKKKRTEKRRDLQQKRERRKQRNEKPAPSKEVFASGDNILVSVSFNKETNKSQQTTIVTLPPTKEQILPKKTVEREAVPKRSKRGPRKHKKITAKPVAIIDLDRSPFKEITPSPKAVIVLSDSDREDNNNTDKPEQPTVPVSDNEVTSSNIGSRCMDAQNDQISQPQSPILDDLSFENTTLGPKTPPEPSSIVKFSLPIKMKNKLRVVTNPLHETHEDETTNDKQSEDSTLNVIDSSQQQNKVGPNTPPESGPCSPDAYDPFEPTKSASQSPENHSNNCDSSPNDRDDAHASKSDISTNQEDKLQQQQQQQQQDKTVKPVDLTIALINSKASMDAAHSLLSSTLEGGVNESEIIDDDVRILSPIEIIDDIPKPQTINVLSNVILSHSKESIRQRSAGLAIPSFSSSAISPAKTVASSSTPKQSPMKPKFSATSIISKLPLPKPSKPITVSRHNGGNDENMDIDVSPYSPDSSDYDGLFEPPNISPPPSQQKKGKAAKGGSGGKTELFEDLFGASPANKLSTGRNKKQRSKKSSIKEWLSENKKTGSAFAKMTDDQIRILDDLPSSAVDLQVKDKFLRKIHRQERVVEEVKLVLKPHYNKKHISKDDYKEILRRAVPKICHNRTGEINPKKIHALIEAYVKKFRHRRKQTSTNVK